MRKILFLENQTNHTDIVQQLLTPAGFDVLSIPVLNADMSAAEAWQPDVIILDLLQPSPSDLKTCQMIKQQSSAPLLVLSAVIDPIITANLLDHGADDVLSKPVKAAVLLAHINMLLRRQSSVVTL